MLSPNNPAGRLHGILNRARAVGKNANRPAIKVWPEVLRAKPGRDDVLLARIARALELPSVVKRRVESIPDQKHEKFLTWVPTVSKAFQSHNFDEPFTQFIAGINEHVVSLVEFCDDLLSEHQPERTVTDEQLAKLQAEIDRFVNEVRAADIDEMLRDYLLHYADLIDRAIGDYYVVGIDAIDRAVESCAGAIFARKPVVEAVAATPVGKNFARLVVAFMMGVGAYSGVKELASDLTRLLPAAALEVKELPVEEKLLTEADCQPPRPENGDADQQP